MPTAVILHSLLGGVVQQLAASPAPNGTVFSTPDGRRYLDDLVDSVMRGNRVPEQ